MNRNRQSLETPLLPLLLHSPFKSDPLSVGDPLRGDDRVDDIVCFIGSTENLCNGGHEVD